MWGRYSVTSLTLRCYGNQRAVWHKRTYLSRTSGRDSVTWGQMDAEAKNANWTEQSDNSGNTKHTQYTAHSPDPVGPSIRMLLLSSFRSNLDESRISLACCWVTLSSPVCANEDSVRFTISCSIISTTPAEPVTSYCTEDWYACNSHKQRSGHANNKLYSKGRHYYHTWFELPIFPVAGFETKLMQLLVKTDCCHLVSSDAWNAIFTRSCMNLVSKSATEKPGNSLFHQVPGSQADHSQGTLKFPDISLTLDDTPTHVTLPMSRIFCQCYQYTINASTYSTNMLTTT